MSDPQPIRFSVPEAEFDLALLPEAARQQGSQAFREAVTNYFKDAYREAGGRVDVGFAGGAIEVNWEPQSGQVPAGATITAHLEAGRYDEAIPLLRTRLKLEPDHVESLYNLGMVCSDRMELTEARQLLSRAVELDPSHVNAQVALGIAALRDRDTAAARAPLEKAAVLEPRNPFARRTLGQLLLMEDETEAALPHLKAAAEVAAEDPINLFTYAQALLASDGDSHVAEADALFKQALRLAPVGELAEKIKNQQRKLADRVMRANAQGMPRMDAVEYLISALQAYRALEPEGQKQLLAEVVALSQRGLAINDPNQKHTLTHYRGGSTVSALEAACVYYAGVKLLLPGQDPGLDLGREYALAQGMAGEGAEAPQAVGPA
jgi:tetratricopeptide (TPR) repeat protein